MTRGLLTINAGSSSIKFSLYAIDPALAATPAFVGQIDGIGARPHIKAVDETGRPIDNVDIPLAGDADAQHHAALEFLVDWLHAHEAGWQIVAVSHRVVHGGVRYGHPIVLDAAIVADLDALIPLAPLHQPHNLDGIRAMMALLPGIPQVACFDTAFHRTQPAFAQLFALPRAITAEGVRRYGFHGLSYEFIARSLPDHTDRADGRVVVAHLGNGASMCAMVGRQSVGTTMGFTAVDGLMMGTRTGAIDPGVLLYLMDRHGYDAKALTHLLYKESGLLGVSGISPDMRTLLASDQPEAAEAVGLFCYRIRRELGSLAASAGGLDVLVFTGGIGEHAAEVRRRVCEESAWLGIRLDPAANAAHRSRISTPDSQVDVLVVPTNEEWMLAEHAHGLLGF